MPASPLVPACKRAPQYSPAHSTFAPDGRASLDEEELTVEASASASRLTIAKLLLSSAPPALTDAQVPADAGHVSRLLPTVTIAPFALAANLGANPTVVAAWATGGTATSADRTITADAVAPASMRRDRAAWGTWDVVGEVVWRAALPRIWRSLSVFADDP